MSRAKSAPISIIIENNPRCNLFSTSLPSPVPGIGSVHPNTATDDFLSSVSFEQQACRRDVLQSMQRLKELEDENKKILKSIDEIGVRKRAAIDRLVEVQANVKVPELVQLEEKKTVTTAAAPTEIVDLSEEKIQKLLNHMRDSKTGIEVKDRWWRLRMYPACFIGSELVDWLIASGWARTREGSKAIGSLLAQQQKIYHSMKEHSFEDGYFYYRFKDAPPPKRADKVWCFGKIVRNFSVGLSSRLAQKIEDAGDDVMRLQVIKELRQNVLYLATSHKTASGWNLRRSRNGVDTYLMERTLRDPTTKQRYNSRIVKTVGMVEISPAKFLEEFLDFKTRPRWESLFGSGKVVTRLGASTNIIYRSSTSPLKSIWPRDVCVLQDHFNDPEEGHAVYEISVEHQEVPPKTGTGYVRAEVLMTARVARKVPDKPNMTELTLISQVDFKGTSAPEWFVVPDWFIDKWIGLDCFGTKTPDGKEVDEGSLNVSFPNVLMDKYMGNDKKHSSAVGARDFEPLSVLGRGAYSKIMQVRLKSTGNLYAMKVLRKGDVIQSKHVQHVMAERNILTSMSHPFIVRLYFSFQTQSKLYMIMSYAAGGDLFTYLRRKGLAEHVAAFYTAELVLGLRHIHYHKIAHRDVKPENILFGEDGHILLADFGLSKEHMTTDKRTFSLSGTSEYLAPEMILNKGHGKEVDWWQLGIVIHEMLTGKHPFYSQNPYRMHQNILSRDPVLDPRLSPEAKSLLLGFFVKDPVRRLGSKPGDIESHAFFRKHNTDWQAILAKKLDPPFRPSLRDARDVSHFEEVFTREKPLLTPSPSASPMARGLVSGMNESRVGDPELISQGTSEMDKLSEAGTDLTTTQSAGVMSVGGMSNISDEEDPFEEKGGKLRVDGKLGASVKSHLTQGDENKSETGYSSGVESLGSTGTIAYRKEKKTKKIKKKKPKSKEKPKKGRVAKKNAPSKDGRASPLSSSPGSTVGTAPSASGHLHNGRKQAQKDEFQGFSFDGESHLRNKKSNR